MSPEQLVIRKARSGDVEAVARLERELFSDPWSEQTLRDSLSQPVYRMYVAESDGAVCGYLILTVVLGEAELLRIAVEASRQGQGVGRRLMERLTQLCREEEADSVYLEVRESNRRAIALYAGAGFQPVGCRKNYYRNPTENASLMRWQAERNSHCK